MSEAICKGAFAFGTACGKCSACQKNLDKICEMTGLVRPERAVMLEKALTKLRPLLDAYDEGPWLEAKMEVDELLKEADNASNNNST